MFDSARCGPPTCTRQHAATLHVDYYSPIQCTDSAPKYRILNSGRCRDVLPTNPLRALACPFVALVLSELQRVQVMVNAAEGH